MRIKLFSNYLPLLCLTACVWVSCSQNREKKSGKKDHTPVMRLTTTTIDPFSALYKPYSSWR